MPGAKKSHRVRDLKPRNVKAGSAAKIRGGDKSKVQMHEIQITKVVDKATTN